MKKLLLLICLPLNMLGQNTIGLPRIINYTKSDYGGGTQTWDIAQDKKGLMYFANNEGLITFDGNFWKNYPLPNKTIMRSLAIDEKGLVYAGGQGEIGYFEPDEKGTLLYHSLEKLIPGTETMFADIWDIEIFEGAVYFRATDRIFELRENSIRVFKAVNEWIFLQQAGKRLFAQDKHTGLLEFRNQQWQPLVNNRVLENEAVSGLIEKDKEGFLITSLKGLFVLRNDSVFKHETGLNLNLENNDIYKSTGINNGEFGAATTTEGCLVIDMNGKVVQKISLSEGLQNSNVLCVFLDRDKNIWTGLNNGISFIAYNSAVKYIKPSKTNEVSGYSTRIFNNQLYIATSGGAYFARVSSPGQDFSYSRPEFSLIKNSIGEAWNLDVVNNKLLMGHNNGTYMIEQNDAVLLSKQPSWLFVPISDVIPSKQVLAGTYTGLQMLDFSENRFTSNGKLDGLYESLRFLAIDNNNIIWASHPYRGIYQLQLSPDQKKYSARLFTDKDGLPSSLGNHVFRIKSRVVFATEKGVYEFNAATGKFIPSPLLSDVFGTTPVRYLKEDDAGNIWFCSGKKIGVANFDAAKKEKPYSITYFPEMTGQILSGLENIYPYNKENIFIGSEKGVIHLNYQKYLLNKPALSVLIGQVKAFGKSDSLLFGGYFNTAADSIYKQDKKSVHKLPISNNSIHFEFSSPVFGLSKNIEYSYQLDGYDNRWSAWSAKTEKDFTNLSQGTYVFRVKARDNLGNESAISSYSFVILPAWYNTIWAYILYGIIVILGIWLLNRRHEMKLQLQKQKFEEEQKKLKYIHQLEIEKNEKEIIKLQNEKLENEIIFKSKELADANLHLVERSDALLKIKEELQKLYKKSGENHDIKKALHLLNDIEKNNSNWEQFASHFDEVNNDFLKKLKQKFPVLSKTDLKVCAYLQLNLSSKEIAQLMNISVRGVEISRYRLRKKLEIPTEQGLGDFLNSI